MISEATSVEEAQVLELFASHSASEVQEIVSTWKIKDGVELEALKKYCTLSLLRQHGLRLVEASTAVDNLAKVSEKIRSAAVAANEANGTQREQLLFPHGAEVVDYFRSEAPRLV